MLYDHAQSTPIHTEIHLSAPHIHLKWEKKSIVLVESVS
jgi:hypothetical protein